MNTTTERTNQRLDRSLLVSLAMIGFVLSVLPHLAGCRPSLSPPVSLGGDSPVTSDRLSGARLTYIRGSLSWSFRGADLLIENENRPIPTDVIEEILGDGSSPMRIEAKWSYDERTSELLLSQITADGIEQDRVVAVAIAPAGAVRVNLGTRQYNVFPKGAFEVVEEISSDENSTQSSNESTSRTAP